MKIFSKSISKCSKDFDFNVKCSLREYQSSNNLKLLWSNFSVCFIVLLFVNKRYADGLVLKPKISKKEQRWLQDGEKMPLLMPLPDK